MPVTILDERPVAAETRRAAVLFADLRGYTALAERLNPLSVVRLLDEYFSILFEAVEDHGGAVFHSAGDSLMAGVGLEAGGSAPVQAALGAGRRIVAAMAPASARWRERLGVATGVGVGLNVGDVAVTELGPPPARRRTLIGDTVNVAARLCQRARAGEVLLSGGVVDALGPAASDGVIALPDLTVRGRGAFVRIYCVPARERVVLDTPAGATVAYP